MTSDLSSRVRAAIEAEMQAENAKRRLASFTAENWMKPCPMCGKPVRGTTVEASVDALPVPLPCGCRLSDDQLLAAKLIEPRPNPDVLRRCEADLRTLDRHRSKLEFEILVVNGVEQRTCAYCGHPWPCADFRDRAAAYGVPVEETT